MTPEALIEALTRRRMTLSSRDGQLVCKGPRSGLTPALRQHLRALKPQVIELLSAREAAERAAARTPPLSISQARIRRLSLLIPATSPAGNIPLGFRIHGDLDVDRLARAIAGLGQRFDVFRSRCDGAHARVLDRVDVLLERHDLRALPVDQRESTLSAHLTDLLDRPFDLTEPPLLRAAVYRIDEQDRALMLVSHVFAFDGRSTPLLLDALSALYADPDAELAAAPEYAAFARSQRAATDRTRAARAFWRQALADVIPDPGPPEDTRRRGVFDSLVVPVSIPTETATAARALARRHGGTLFHVLLGAFATLLERYGTRPAVAVGTIASHRPDADAERTVGSFAQPILVPARLGPNETFGGLIEHVRGTLGDAMAQLDLPFEALLPDLTPAQRRAAPFRVMFVLHQGGRRGVRLHLGSTRVEPMRRFPSKTNHTLELVLADNVGVVRGHLIVDGARLPRADAEAFVERYVALLGRLVDSPAQLLSTLDRHTWPTATRALEHPTVRPPLGDIERRLADIWAELLGQPVEGRDLDFFALGGHSLLALSMLARVEADFGPLAEDAVARFGRDPTITGLASTLHAR